VGAVLHGQGGDEVFPHGSRWAASRPWPPPSQERVPQQQIIHPFHEPQHQSPSQPPPPSKSTTQRMPHSAGINQPSRNSSNSADSHRHEPRDGEERPVVAWWVIPDCYLHRKEERIAFCISASAWDVRRRCGSTSAAGKTAAWRGGVGMWERKIGCRERPF
jgi:hypothetical protein